MALSLPSDSQRITIIGRTGSGKTFAGAYQLSLRSFDRMPWIVYDFKYDGLLNEIEGTRELGVTEDIPKHPGIYLVHPHPDQFPDVISQMWKIWEKENVGVFCDEGYMVCSPSMPNPAFRSILTQGRSKQIPVIILSQRPVWLDRFVFSESDFYQVFSLNDKRDKQTVQAFVPADLDTRLPDYHSWYYDVSDDRIVVAKPVPEKQVILNSFTERLKKQNKIYIL